MSVHRTGDGGGLSYSDLNWLQLTFDTDFGGGSGAIEADAVVVGDVDVHEELNLDNNELAELVYLYRMFTGNGAIEDDFTASAIGNIELSSNLEVNSGEAEWALSDQLDTPTSARQRPGFIDAVEVHTFEFIKDIANGVAGGGAPMSVTKQREMSWLQMGLETGPALDANDELNHRIEWNKNSHLHGGNVKVVFQLGFRTHKIEGTRNEFAIPTGD